MPLYSIMCFFKTRKLTADEVRLAKLKRSWDDLVPCWDLSFCVHDINSHVGSHVGVEQYHHVRKMRARLAEQITILEKKIESDKKSLQDPAPTVSV